MYGNADDAVIRISLDIPEPTNAKDDYSPHADVGYLSIRYAQEWPVVSGWLDVAYFPDEEVAEHIMYQVLEQFLKTDEQVHCRIALTNTRYTMIQSGEESFFLTGRG